MISWNLLKPDLLLIIFDWYAAGEAIEEKLGHPSQGYSNPKGLEGAVSVDKIPPLLGQAQH